MNLTLPLTRQGRTNRIALRAKWALLACGLALSCAAGAQANFPNKPIRVIVPFGAGTGVDVAARALSSQLSAQLGSSVYVENREGASGDIGAAAVQSSSPDGYTLLFAAHPPFVVGPMLKKVPSYDVFKGFTPIAKVGSIYMALIGTTKGPFKTFDELVDYAQKNPGKLNYGHPGQGTLAYLDVERIMLAKKLNVLEVPYKATGQVMTDTIAGILSFGLPSLPAALPFAQSGQIQLLAIGSPSRLPSLPNVPTLAEVLKQPGFLSNVWYGMFGPANMPAEVKHKLFAEVDKAMKAPKVLESFEHSMVTPTVVGPEDFAKELQRNTDESRQLLNALGIKPQ